MRDPQRQNPEGQVRTSQGLGRKAKIKGGKVPEASPMAYPASYEEKG